MGKKRNTLGTTGTPVTNDLVNDNSGLDNITRAASGSSLYQENSGASDVGGRMQNAGFTNGYFNGKLLGFDTGEVTEGYKKMGNDSFDPFSNNNDYEKIRKDNQSAAAAYTNMFGQFVAKTALNAVGGVIGSFYGIGSSVVNGDATKLIDNSFLRGVDEASEGVDELAPVFTSQADKEKGVFGIFSGLETVKSVSDAFAFTAGAVLTELTMQTVGNAVTGGAAELGVGARLARYAAKTGTILGEENAIGRTLVRGGEYIGVGDKLKRIGERAELAGAFLKDVDSPAARAIIEKAAMKEGMSLDQLQNYMKLSQKFDNFGSGLRKVMSGSLYEGSLEGRQAYDKMMQNADATIDAQLTSEGFVPGEKRDREKEKRLSASEQDAKNLMLGVTAANVGLLSISNALQFPTLFGMKSFPATKSVDNMSSLFLRDAVSGTAKEIEQKGIAKIGAGAVKVLEHPFEEFMEETLQGVISKTSQNFHDRLTETASQTAGLEHPVSEFMSSLSKGFSEEYGSKEGWEEGLIGAIVGGIGAPSFKRNSKGKIRPTMAGGVVEALQGRSKEEKARIQDALDVLNSDSQLNSLKYNLEQSKLNSFSTNEKNKSVAADDDKAFESAGTDEVFQHVANYLDKGLKGSLEEETEALKNLSPEEYTLKTRGKDQQVVTAEEQKAELDDYTRKVETYTNAYEKVFKSMRMDKMNDNPINQRLLNHLAYAVAKDKEELLQFDNQSKELKNKGLKMTESELYALALMHGKIGTKTNKDIEDELTKYDNEEHPEYKEKINKLVETEFKENSKEGILNKAKDSDYFKKIKMKYGIRSENVLRDTRRKVVERENEKSAVERLLSPSEVELKREVDFTDEFNKELKERILKKHKSENKYNKEDYVSKEQLLDENARIAERNNVLNREAADKFQQKQSAAMDHLAGKPKAITLKDINDYKESLQKYKEQLTADETVPRSFLDQLDSYQSKDINKALDKLAGTIMRREASLRVAANLYGLEGVNRAVQAVANAELITNYNNNKYFRKVLNYFIKNGSADDSGGEAALASEKLRLSNKALVEIVKNLKTMAAKNNVEENTELIDHLENEIKMANDLLEDYKENTEAEDAKDKAEKSVSSESGENSSEEINKKVTKEKVKASDEEIEEAKNINDLILKHGELVNKPKQSWKLYTGSESGYRDDNLRSLVEQGTIGMNNVVYFRPSDNLEMNEQAKSLMNEKQLELYNKGREIFENDPTIIGNKDVMDINKFMIDDKIQFDNSDDAAIQFFTMTFVSNKEITNDFSISLDNGTKSIIKKKDDERVVSNSFLYSPYFSFEKTNDKADAYIKQLNEDRTKLIALNNQLKRKDVSDVQKIDIKKQANLLNISITARELRANDATLYELRKQILMGITLHKNSSLKDEPYAMRALVKDFDYGRVSEHTIDNERLPTGVFNNFPLVNVGETNSKNFDSNDNFLSDEATVEELFNQDKLAICYQDKSLVYMNSNKKVSFQTKDSTEDTESKDENGDTKEAELKENDTDATPYSVGSMYYMHETKTGILIPVRLNMQTIDKSESVMKGLEKYIQVSIDQIKEREKDHGKTLKIYDEEISIEEGDFDGMFDNDSDAPKTLHKLLEYFLPHYNSTKDLDAPLMVYKSGEENQVLDNEDISAVEATGEATDDYFEKLKSETKEQPVSKTKSKSKKAVTKLHVDFGTEKKTIEEFTEQDMKAIMDNIGSMRFYFKKHLSINQAKPQGEKLVKPNVLSFAFTSGLITHGFDVANNVEKIYSPFEPVIEEGVFVEKQVGLTIVPMDDDVLGKTKIILGKSYASKDIKQLFMPSLRNVFKFDTKYNKEHKVAFDLKSINRQIKFLIDKRFKEISKEEGISKTSTENERKEAYKKAVESQLALFKSELGLIKDKFKNEDRKRLITLIEKQVDKFGTQFKDIKNANIFRSIYMNKSQEEYFDELNDLLFNSPEMNNELSPILPLLTRPSANSPITFSSKEEGITKERIQNIISSIEENNELSKKYKSAGGKDFLPIDIEIAEIERDKKVDKFSTEKERHSTYLDKTGTPKTKNQPAESIKIHSLDPLFYQKEDGKLAKFDPSDIDKVLKFDEDGKLTRGILFLNVTGYKKGKFLVLAVGTETLKENKSGAVKDDGKKTFRYVSGINFFGRNKDLSVSKKENNALENILSEKQSASDATPKLYAKLNPSKTVEDSYQEAYDDAMSALSEAEETAEKVRQEYENLKAKATRPAKKATAKKEETTTDAEDIEEVLKSRRNSSTERRWVLEEMAPDIEDGGDLAKYDQENVTNGFIKDLKSAKEKDFSKMSDKEVLAFIKNETGDGPGAAQELFLKAMEEDSARAKTALNFIVDDLYGKASPVKKKSKSVTNLISETEEGEGEMDIAKPSEVISKALENKIADIEKRRQEEYEGNVTFSAKAYSVEIEGKSYEIIEQLYEGSSDNPHTYIKNDKGEFVMSSETESLLSKSQSDKIFLRDETDEWRNDETKEEIDAKYDSEILALKEDTVNPKKQKKQVDTSKNTRSTVLDLFNESKTKQLKRVVLTKNIDLLKTIIDEAIENNKGATNLENDIFVSASNSVFGLENNKLPNNEDIHMIAKAVFGNDYSEENTNNIIKEYNKNCKA
jgi:hypothetical protein